MRSNVRGTRAYPFTSVITARSTILGTHRRRSNTDIEDGCLVALWSLGCLWGLFYTTFVLFLLLVIVASILELFFGINVPFYNWPFD